MKAYTGMKQGIKVSLSKPYSRLILGEGGNKRATWIPLGKRDEGRIVEKTYKSCDYRGNLSSAPSAGGEYMVCGACGISYEDTEEKYETYAGDKVPAQKHPDTGEYVIDSRIMDVGLISLKDKQTGKPNGKYLIVSPRGNDQRVLVLWQVSSGYRGSASISAGEGVKVIAQDSSWHSGRGSLGETAECLAILSPGQFLTARRSGRRVQETRARLRYDGKAIIEEYGDEQLFEATSDEEPCGDYV